MIELSVQDKAWVDSLFEKLDKKLTRSAVNLKDIIPFIAKDGRYNDMAKEDITWWTNGFFGGMMWLMYNETKKEEYKIAAERQEELLDKAFEVYDGLHHDVGFMWGITAKANYTLTGNKKSRVRCLHAANFLFARTNIRGKYIKAWPNKDYTIIDSMMNIPLLYWASREIGDDRYKYVALMHADSVLKHHIREDGSVAHIAVHNTQKDEVIETLAGQGCAVGSAWSRGQSWAVYGYALSYIHTGEKKYLDAAIKTADYFIKEAAKSGYKVLTDFCQPKDVKFIDTSAAVCAACGMIEIYKTTGDKYYLDSAIKILKALECDLDFSEENQSILQNCMISYDHGIQLHHIYADFFLCEAVLKLKNSDFLIW